MDYLHPMLVLQRGFIVYKQESFQSLEELPLSIYVIRVSHFLVFTLKDFWHVWRSPTGFRWKYGRSVFLDTWIKKSIKSIKCYNFFFWHYLCHDYINPQWIMLDTWISTLETIEKRVNQNYFRRTTR